MKENSLNATRAALKSFLSDLVTATDLPMEEHWEYHRGEGQSWHGSVVQEPSFGGMYGRGSMRKGAASIREALLKDYPEYLSALGFLNSAGALQTDSMLLQLAYEVFRRFGTWVPSENDIESVLSDAAAFFDSKTVRLCLEAPALNLRGPQTVKPIKFPGGIVLRATTDEDITRFFGGSVYSASRANPLPFPDFLFSKEFEVPKVVGDLEKLKAVDVAHSHGPDLERCFLALSTFKDAAAVGYDNIYVRPVGLVLGVAAGTQRITANEKIPFGFYDLTPEEGPKIECHARCFETLHQTLEMACQRLVDGSRRSKARDTIVDSVIGLESILLANIPDRGELRFRFSLNYASLFPRDERRAAFSTAQDLYDIRSKIAHGVSPKTRVKIGDGDYSLDQAAKLARGVLQRTIAFFVSNAQHPDFMAKGYWETKQLGL